MNEAAGPRPVSGARLAGQPALGPGYSRRRRGGVHRRPGRGSGAGVAGPLVPLASPPPRPRRGAGGGGAGAGVGKYSRASGVVSRPRGAPRALGPDLCPDHGER